MQGKRIADNTRPKNPGEYSKFITWCVMNPNGGLGSLTHTVTEHPDGTITVVPSILHHAPKDKPTEGWHGFLENGIWRTC